MSCWFCSLGTLRHGPRWNKMSPSFSKGLGQARSWPLQGSGGNSGTEDTGQRQASSQMLSLIRGRSVPGKAGKPRWITSQSSAHPCVDLSRGWGDRTQGTLAGWPLSPFRSPQPPVGPGRRDPRSADVRAQPVPRVYLQGHFRRWPIWWPDTAPALPCS